MLCAAIGSTNLRSSNVRCSWRSYYALLPTCDRTSATHPSRLNFPTPFNRRGADVCDRRQQAFHGAEVSGNLYGADGTVQHVGPLDATGN
jgi:hypothetical protein